jgi:hypothetical protein
MTATTPSALPTTCTRIELHTLGIDGKRWFHFAQRYITAERNEQQCKAELLEKLDQSKEWAAAMRGILPSEMLKHGKARFVRCDCTVIE